jgi:hypothetical protein
MPDLNEGINVDELLEFKEMVEEDSAHADPCPWCDVRANSLLARTLRKILASW